MNVYSKLIILLFLIPLSDLSVRVDNTSLPDTKNESVTNDEAIKNLVINPGFEILNPSTGLPEGWSTKSPRRDIAPIFSVDRTVSHSGKYSAKSASNGSNGTYGLWTTTVTGIQDASDARNLVMENTMPDSLFLSNKHFRVGCYYKTDGIESPDKNVWIAVNWLDKTGNQIFSELISSYKKEGEWYHASKVLTAPRPAVALNIELIVQWSASGKVWWDDIQVENAPAPAPRKIKIATSCSQPPSPSTTEKNLKFYADKIIEAGKLGVDILCLGEGITKVSTDQNFKDVAEPVPGISTGILGEAARKAGIYVVAGIYESDGPLMYNTAILIDRKGNIAGKYRKTHLPETESGGGLTPGTSYPVFQTDFGTIGIQICYDNFFPEVARNLALNGAEVILLPIWGDTRDQNYCWDIVARARAIDNAVYLVSSMYNRPDGCMIINRNGRILKDIDKAAGLITAEVDLNSRTFDRWLSFGSYGEWKTLFPQERRSETYNRLLMNTIK